MDRLMEAGYALEQIRDITSVVGFCNLSNRLALLADMRPNSDFDGLGR